MRRARVAAGLGCVLVMVQVAAQGARQAPLPRPMPPPIDGASVFMVERDEPALAIDVTNRHVAPLEQIAVQLRFEDGIVTRPLALDRPLATGERRRFLVADDDPLRRVEVGVELAAFADGHLEGLPDVVAAWRARMAAIMEDLAAWQAALAVMPRSPQNTAFAFLRSTIDLRLQASPADPSGVRRMVEVWLRQERLPSFTFTVVEQAQRDITGRLERSRQRMTAPAPDPLRGASTPVVSAGPATMTVYALEIVNRRPLALEAWNASVRGARAAGRRAFADDAGAKLPEEGARPIGPHERRQIGVYEGNGAAEPDLTAVLELAVWENLSYGGWQSSYEQLLANRERRANAYRDWIPTLHAASALPPQPALALIGDTLRQRSQGPAGGQSDPVAFQFDAWQALAARDADALSTTLAAFAQRLAEHEQRLLRHRRR